MADEIIKVKPRPTYQWNQDEKTIHIRIPIKGTSIKKIDILVCDVLLKVNCMEQGFVRILDLSEEVDSQSKDNTFQYVQQRLEITLIKKEPKKWTDLLVSGDLPKDQLKKRREYSFKRKEEIQLEFLKARKDLKIKYDNFATREMMSLEEEQRSELDMKRKREKEMAQQELLDDIIDGEDDQEEEIDLQNKLEDYKEGEKERKQLQEGSREIWDQKELGQGSQIEAERPVSSVTTAPSQKKSIEPGQQQQTTAVKKSVIKQDEGPEIVHAYKYDWRMWDDDYNPEGETQAEREKQKQNQIFQESRPMVRESKQIPIQFTERVFPQLAMRQQHLKEAPLPKLRSIAQSTKGGDLDLKNPLWLQDKGDDFFRNNDYYSAMNAYNQAFKLDENMISCIANRAACNLNLFNFQQVLIDCGIVLQFLEQKPSQEKNSENITVMVAKIQCRKTIALCWSGRLVEGESLIKEIKANLSSKLSDELRSQLNGAEEQVQKRITSTKTKVNGDQLFQAGQIDLALAEYERALTQDAENEVAGANVSASLLKLGQNQECLQACDRWIDQLNRFIRYCSFNAQFRGSSVQSNQLLIQLYLRKAKAQQLLGQFTEGYETIRLALQIDDKDTETRNIYHQLERELNKKKVLDMKQHAASLVKQTKMRQALEIYNQCLQIIDSDDYIDVLAILLNRCACYVHLELYEDIVSTCVRGLQIIRNQNSRILALDQVKVTREHQEKLLAFQVRFLVRRANAYIKQNLLYNAKSDLEEGIKLDPTNTQIKSDLNQILTVLN